MFNIFSWRRVRFIPDRPTPINSARGLESPMAAAAAAAAAASPCIFCQIAGKSTSTTLLHTDEKVVAFQDINPAAVRHYLVIPVDHIPTVKDLQRRPEDYSLDLDFISLHSTPLTIFTYIVSQYPTHPDTSV